MLINFSDTNQPFVCCLISSGCLTMTKLISTPPILNCRWHKGPVHMPLQIFTHLITNSLVFLTEWQSLTWRTTWRKSTMFQWGLSGPGYSLVSVVTITHSHTQRAFSQSLFPYVLSLSGHLVLIYLPSVGNIVQIVFSVALPHKAACATLF